LWSSPGPPLRFACTQMTLPREIGCLSVPTGGLVGGAGAGMEGGGGGEDTGGIAEGAAGKGEGGGHAFDPSGGFGERRTGWPFGAAEPRFTSVANS
jgi:hypothetical protein